MTTPSNRFVSKADMIDIAEEMHDKYAVTMVAGEGDDTANSPTTSGNTYLNVVEDGTVRSSVRLVPGTNMSIVSDGLGNVTLQATNTKYGLTRSGNNIYLVENGGSSYIGLDYGTLEKDDETGRYVNSSITTWFENMSDGLVYGLTIPKGSATTCTKTGANASYANPIPGVVGTPAVDPYYGIGPFIFFEANGGVDADGTPYVTAIRYIDEDFARDGSNGDVVIMTAVLSWAMTEDEDNVYLQLSDTKYDTLEYQPQAYLPDGTLRPYMLYAKYAGSNNGENVMVSVSGKPTWTRSISHNSLITYCQNSTTGYSGKSVADDWYVKVMFLMKYATKNSQGVFAGCTNYYYNYAVTVAETGVTRVIISKSNADNLVVGSSVVLGANDHSTSVLGLTRILSIESYDGSNSAVNLDVETTFDTTTSLKLCTEPWFTGSCDEVEGDGSMGSNTNGKYPFVIQGIECMVGCYEVLGDVIIHSDGESGWIPYICNDSRNEATSFTSDYVSTGLSLPVDSNDSWKYPLYPENGNGLLFGTTTGGSQSAGLCDGHYTNKVTTSGDREWLSFGILLHGGNAGVWGVAGSIALSGVAWGIGSRRSYNGRSRG